MYHHRLLPRRPRGNTVCNKWLHDLLHTVFNLLRGGRVRIAVVGAGAIGAYWGAALHRGGSEVHLIARGAHLEAMRENGVLVLSQRGDFTARPHVTDDPREIGPVD